MSIKLISDTRRTVREDFIVDTESTSGLKLQIVLYLGIPRLDWCHITTVDISFRRTFQRQIKIFEKKCLKHFLDNLTINGLSKALKNMTVYNVIP